MCKYGMYDVKFSLSDLNEQQHDTLADTFGIELNPNNRQRFERTLPLDSVAGRSLLNWAAKHSKMAKDHATVRQYCDIMKTVGVIPFPDTEYTGYQNNRHFLSGSKKQCPKNRFT
jgi:hypothetical protein